MAEPDEASAFHHCSIECSPEAVACPGEEDGLIAELAVLAWLLPKAEPQTRPGCCWLTWEVIPSSTVKDVGRERQGRERSQHGVLVSKPTGHLDFTVLTWFLKPCDGTDHFTLSHEKSNYMSRTVKCSSPPICKIISHYPQISIKILYSPSRLEDSKFFYASGLPPHHTV